MFFRSWGSGPKVYVSIVENKRIDGKVRQKTIAYLGLVDASSVPYLKAAFMRLKDRPTLVYPNGEKYDPRSGQ